MAEVKVLKKNVIFLVCDKSPKGCPLFAKRGEGQKDGRRDKERKKYGDGGRSLADVSQIDEYYAFTD